MKLCRSHKKIHHLALVREFIQRERNYTHCQEPHHAEALYHVAISDLISSIVHPPGTPQLKKLAEKISTTYKSSPSRCVQSAGIPITKPCWPLLNSQHYIEKRCTKTSLCHLFKIINKLTHYLDPPILQWESQHITRSSAPNRLIVPHSNTAYRQCSFAHQQSYYH